jgi:hypothetical protein
MDAPPPPATLAPRLGAILRDLAALVARRLLRLPLYAVLAIPLWQQISRATLRLESLLARLAAGPLPPSRPRARRHPGSPRRKSSFPAARAWLISALGHEAAACASQLQALLAEPAAAALLATPAGSRALAPIRRMLGLTPPRSRPSAPPVAATPPRRPYWLLPAPPDPCRG